ncbi:MAG: histidine phosphatase family protein [Lachnospiraceae bacterium]|jgi:alpha-ribazole phosphatase
MIKLYLIRHSKTYGNTLGRYIGRQTDEPLCEEGIQLLNIRQYPEVQQVFVSPMLRCLQTAKHIYPDKPSQIVDELAECDFGAFENKNYKELEGDVRYQEWIDSNGELPFPEGESRTEFMQRSLKGFRWCVEHCISTHIDAAALVVHGGTIMSILDAMANPHEEYYHWQAKNACGYEITVDESLWKQGTEQVTVIKKIE